MNTIDIDIRPAQTRDANAIAGVHEEAWRVAYSGLIPHKTLTSMIGRRGGAWWDGAIRRSGSVLVVELGGVIAGYATIGRNRARGLSQQGEIYELYLKPEYQGIGLGTRLFATARARLERLGLKGLIVWALEDNAGALAFYASAGGKDIAEGIEVFENKTLRKIAFAWN